MSLTSTDTPVARPSTVAGTCPDSLVRAVRAEVCQALGWQKTADRVACALRANLPDPTDLLPGQLRQGELRDLADDDGFVEPNLWTGIGRARSGAGAAIVGDPGQVLAKLPKRVRVIAEPGRYIAGPAAIGVATVMGRARREGHWWYYLDDGLYGSYSGQIYDHARYPVESLRQGGPLLPAVLAGPTCDSIDVIAENLMLPELKAGDLIVGRAMGAYTWASASEFNFFPKATVVAVNRRSGDTGGVE